LKFEQNNSEIQSLLPDNYEDVSLILKDQLEVSYFKQPQNLYFRKTDSLKKLISDNEEDKLVQSKIKFILSNGDE
jgi:hypothetical protein